MALVRFDQDPEMPDGTGLFHADDGSSMYAHDPQMAMQLSPELQAAAEPPPDERMAQNEYASYQPEQISSASAPPPQVASPQKPDVAPPMAPAPQPAPAAPAQAEQVDADRLQKNIDDYAMRPVVSGPTRGGVVPLKQDVTRETSGPPYDPNGPQATARADAHIDVQLANRAAYASQAARAEGEAAAWQAAMPELQAKAAIAQKRMDTQKRIYRQERADLDDLVAESQASQKSFNANRWFDDRGAVGTIGAGIAQAFGAYSAALVGGDNQIAKQINSYVDRDIANQRAQIESGKAGVDNQLKRLQLKYGDMDQAEAALKIATQKVVDNQIQMYAASTKNADLIAAGDKWLAENQQRYVLAEQAFENASYGKTSVKTDAKVVAPSAGGVRAPTEKEVQQRYETLDKRGKVVEGTYDSEIKRQKALGMDPDKKDKTNELVIQNIDGSTTLARKPEEAEKIRNAYRLRTSATRNFEQIKKVAQESASGGRVGEAKGRIKVLMKRALENVNTMSGQGVFRTDDDVYYTDALFGAGGGVRHEVIDELIGTANNEYQAYADSQLGGEVKESYTTAGPKVRHTGKPSKTPTAKGQFEKY